MLQIFLCIGHDGIYSYCIITYRNPYSINKINKHTVINSTVRQYKKNNANFNIKDKTVCSSSKTWQK